MSAIRTRPSRRRITARDVATVVVCLALATHMFFTFVYNVPSGGVRSALPTEAAAEYMEPYFVQDYRIFAPDPASADHQLWVRAWLDDGSGSPRTTEWINVTEVEIAAAYRRVLRKQLTILGAERMMSSYVRLADAQQEVVAVNYHRAGLERLREDLLAAVPGGDPAAIDAFIRTTRYLDAYATQVAFAMGATPEDLAAVQTRVVYDPVVRWSERDDPDAQRPAATITDTGWRPPLEFSGQDRAEFADTFLAWLDE